MCFNISRAGYDIISRSPAPSINNKDNTACQRWDHPLSAFSTFASI